jgi:hypothetical protein
VREREIQDAIRIAADSQGLALFRNNCGVARMGGRVVRYGVGGPGGPDLVGWCVRSGLFVAIEVKAPGGRQSPAQAVWQTACESRGGLYFVCRSTDDLARVREAIDRRRP